LSIGGLATGGFDPNEVTSVILIDLVDENREDILTLELLHEVRVTPELAGVGDAGFH
jgi:hypothetical protein